MLGDMSGGDAARSCRMQQGRVISRGDIRAETRDLVSAGDCKSWAGAKSAVCACVAAL